MKKITITNNTESTITFSNFALILRGKSTGQGTVTVGVNTIEQENELNLLKNLKYISYTDANCPSMDKENSDKLSSISKESKESKAATKAEVKEAKKYESKKHVLQDNEDVTVMTSEGPQTIKKSLNKLMEIPESEITEASLKAAKELEDLATNDDDFIDGKVAPETDFATVALGNETFEKRELKNSLFDPSAIKKQEKSVVKPRKFSKMKGKYKAAKVAKEISVENNKTSDKNLPKTIKSIKPVGVARPETKEVIGNPFVENVAMSPIDPSHIFVDGFKPE